MKVTSKEQAWAEVNKIFPTDYEKDEASSARAGYDIYRHHTLNYYNRICDLGCRLEVLLGEYGENVTNIWIEEPAADTTEREETKGYGGTLSEKIRARLINGGSLANQDTENGKFEKFALDRGWEFETEEAFKAAYDRAWKTRHGLMLTEDEFLAEVGTRFNTEPETVKTTYAVLAALVDQKKIDASKVYQYARFKWCIRNPDAIVAYQRERDKWEVNNCDTETTEENARIAVCEEWGFEASRVRIIGTPYYDATDYQFIRFDCAHMTWLWTNGNLHQVYA